MLMHGREHAEWMGFVELDQDYSYGPKGIGQSNFKDDFLQ